MTREETLYGWGRWPRRDCAVAAPDGPFDVARALGPTTIARGLGRSYGDSALNPARTVATDRLNRLIGFDADAGVLVAEAGVSLAEVIRVFLPRGFFPMVTPGTKFVTIGG
ncbi:MAG: FAD-binding protein, partial [Pseudomonadota bacterium]